MNNNADNYSQLCHEQLLNLNNLFLITYNNNSQMHNNFTHLLSNTSKRNLMNRNNIFNDEYRRPWQPNFLINNQPRRPPPPPPIPSYDTNFFTNDNIRTRAFPIRQPNPPNRRRNVSNLGRPTPTPRRINRPVGNPLTFTFTSPAQNLLNNSLYDRIPNNPLSTADFLRETTHDTWINIRTLVNLPITSRCVITQEQFNDNDIVSRIYRCGHVFNHNALLRWFQRDTRCPICRYNLTNSTRRNPTRTNSTRANSTQTNSTRPDSTRPDLTHTNSTRPDSRQYMGTTDISNNTQPVTWRDPLVSPVNNSNNIFDSMVSDLEQNITNTILDNSENIMNLSTQVANSLFGVVSNNLNNTPNFSDFMTTGFSFNAPTQSNSTNTFNHLNGFNMGCPNNTQSSRNTTESKTEESTEESTDEEEDVD